MGPNDTSHAAIKCALNVHTALGPFRRVINGPESEL